MNIISRAAEKYFFVKMVIETFFEDIG